MQRLLLILPMIFLCFAASAQEKDYVYDTVVMWGLGNKPCSEFVTAIESQPTNIYATIEDKSYPTLSNAYLQWVAGYLTAYSFAKSVSFNLPDNSLDSAMSWLRLKCKAEPKMSFVFAVNSYAAKFSEPSFTK